jgi:hypothetical protein
VVVLHILLHVRRRRSIRILMTRLGRHIWVLRVVDCRLRNVRIAVDLRALGRRVGPHRRRDHVRRYAAHVIPRARSRADLWLRGVYPLNTLSSMLGKGDAVWYGRRC